MGWEKEAEGFLVGNENKLAWGVGSLNPSKDRTAFGNRSEGRRTKRESWLVLTTKVSILWLGCSSTLRHLVRGGEILRSNVRLHSKSPMCAMDGQVIHYVEGGNQRRCPIILAESARDAKGERGSRLS